MAHSNNQINMQSIMEIENFPAIGSGKTSNTRTFLNQYKQSKQWKSLFESKEEMISKLNLSAKEVAINDIMSLPFFKNKISQSEMRKQRDDRSLKTQPCRC